MQPEIPQTPNSQETTPSDGLGFYSDTQVEPTADDNDSSEGLVQWQASEYIQRERGGLWLAVFMLIAVIMVSVAVYVKAWTFVILIPVMALAVVLYTRRPPRMLNCALTTQGLHINDQLFPYSNYKGFALVHGLDQYTIALIPRRRFSPGVSVGFPDEVGEAVIDTLAARLPMQEFSPDLVDRIIHKLRL